MTSEILRSSNGPEAGSGPRWPPRVQVAGVSSLDEALFCADVGVEALGFTLEVPGGVHDGLTWDKASEIIQKVRQRILTLVITYLNSADTAGVLVKTVNPHAIQFHGGISDEQLAIFCKRHPGTKTIGRVTVWNANAVAEAVCFNPSLWDGIILDSRDPLTGRIGATGITHDWSMSSEIVKVSTLPVILAGGLNPDNVAQAIRVVKPCGVDAHTGVEDRNGTRNLSKIRAFTQAALAAFKAHPH